MHITPHNQLFQDLIISLSSDSENRKKKEKGGGGRWLICKHGTVSLPEVLLSLEGLSETFDSIALFKVFPFSWLTRLLSFFSFSHFSLA